jgi:hypothetical protein
MRGFWFLTGAGVGVYAVVKARRAAEALTPEGLQDRLSALSVGARIFADEVRVGTAEKETELRGRLGLALDRSIGSRELGPPPVETPAGIPSAPDNTYELEAD